MEENEKSQAFCLNTVFALLKVTHVLIAFSLYFVHQRMGTIYIVAEVQEAGKSLLSLLSFPL